MATLLLLRPTFNTARRMLDSRSAATAGQQAFGLVCLLAARLCCDALSAKLSRAGWRLPRLAAHLYSARLASSSQALQASRGVAKTAHVFSRGWRRLCILFGLAGAAGLCGLRDSFAKGAEPMHLMSADGDVFAAAANVLDSPRPRCSETTLRSASVVMSPPVSRSAPKRGRRC